MTTQLTDLDIRTAFAQRAAGGPASDLVDRIHAAAVTTRQERPLIALPGLRHLAPARHLALAATIGAATLVIAAALLSGVGRGPSDPDQPPPIASVPPSASPSGSPVGTPTAPPASPGPTSVPTVSPSPDGGIDCPPRDLADVRLAEIGAAAALACYGGEEIAVTGRVFCMATGDLPPSLEHTVTGPFWLDDGRYCAFQDDSGEPFFEIFEFPTDELPPDWRTVDLTVTGHFDDPESVDCRPAAGQSDMTVEQAVLECRLGFHSTGVTVAD